MSNIEKNFPSETPNVAELIQKLKESAEGARQTKETKDETHRAHLKRMALEAVTMAEGNEKLSRATGKMMHGSSQVGKMPDAYEKELRKHRDEGALWELSNSIREKEKEAIQLEKTMVELGEFASKEILVEAKGALVKIKEDIETKKIELQSQKSQLYQKDEESAKKWKGFASEQDMAAQDAYEFGTKQVLESKKLPERPDTTLGVAEPELRQAVTEERVRRNAESQEKYEQQIELIQKKAVEEESKRLEDAASSLIREYDKWTSMLKGDTPQGKEFLKNYSLLHQQFDDLMGKTYWIKKEEKQNRDREEQRRLLNEMKIVHSKIWNPSQGGEALIHGLTDLDRAEMRFRDALNFAWYGTPVELPSQFEGDGSKYNLVGHQKNIVTWIYQSNERKQRMTGLVMGLDKRAHALNNEMNMKKEQLIDTIKSSLPLPEDSSVSRYKK
ncbi:MAG: hypothetical protein ABI430_02185 [Candidatus Taylorbacteria bacterium]